jgi:hypothetical protein
MPATRLLRLLSALTALLLAAALWQAVALARELLVTTRSLPWMAAFVLGGLALAGALAWALAAWTPAAPRLLGWLGYGGALLRRFGRVNYALFAVCAAALPALTLTPLPEPVGTLLEAGFWRALVFWLAALAGWACLAAGKGTGGEPPPLRLLGYTALLFAAVHRAAAFLPDISAYPFSLTWSEASRYFYASLFLSEHVYGIHVNPTVLHPTRYLMQAVPFLIPSTLRAHRAWQVFLWLATNGLAARLLARRVGQGSPVPVFLWAFLFLFQAPIWYHLVVMIIIVLWGTQTDRFWKTLPAVTLASLWAGMSRINWIPFPAALAITLYLLERPQGDAPLWRYLTPPVVWGLAGLGAGFAAQWGYAVLSGNALDQFTSSLTSDLLWYRLFPSATYPLGVLPGIALATLPAAWLIAHRLRGSWGSVVPIRWLSLAGILLIFFAGGLVVSAKIGGGSNLHNMDAYLALLAVAGASIVQGRLAFDRAANGRADPAPALAWALAAAVPAWFAITVGAPNRLPNPADTAAAYTEIIAIIEQHADGEILFIAERQLLTFGDVSGVALVPEYEKVFLMEMSMSGNLPYLNRFHADLHSRRFALIVSEPVRANPQGRADQFGEENNAWDAQVSLPLLCLYEPLATFEDVRVQLLVPKLTPGCAP